MTSYIVPGPIMDATAIADYDEALAVIRDARAALDPEPIIERLSPDAVYEAQNVLAPLDGYEVIAEYLRERFAFFRKLTAERDIGVMRLGRVSLPQAASHPCLIFEADGEWQALWVLTLNPIGAISRIDILTVAPTPEMAWVPER